MDKPGDDIARKLWADFLATNPGPDYKPWDEMDEVEKTVIRFQLAMASLEKLSGG